MAFDGRMSYGDYLGLDRVLTAQKPLSDAHDEMLFIVQHQTSELWMKLALHELGAARAALEEGKHQQTFKMLARVARIFEQLNSAWDVLRTMTPSDYTRFRDALGQSSGFQSWQYRLIEFAAGNRNRAMVRPHAHRPDIAELLENELRRPSLYDVALNCLAKSGVAVPDAVLSRDVSKPYAPDDGVAAAWSAVYRDPERHWEMYELAEKLVDFEDYFRRWRFNHVTTVERVIGFKRGTGGTAETYYYADGTTGEPGEIVSFATVAAGDTAVLTLDNLEPGDYRIVSDGNRATKNLYKFDFTVAEPETCTVPGSEVYGFETEDSIDADGIDGLSGVSAVKGTWTGMSAAAGCYYAVAGQNLDDADYAYQFTKFGGYSNTFPEGGWFTSADFYLDVDVETGGTLNQFDWSVAANNTEGNHRRDFIFHAQSAGAGEWVLGASNNSGFVGVDASPLSGDDTLTIDESGWYTVTHSFTDVDGVLSVDISVADAEGDVLQTWTRSNDKDVIGDTVGGNRYGWITVNGFDSLPIDNVLINAERPTDGCAPTIYFTDVPAPAKAFMEITWLAEQGIASGYDDGTFRPYASVTRRNMAKLLYRYAGRPDVELPAESPFSDLEPGDGGYRAMVWLHEAEIASGYDDGTFQPNKVVTRRNMAKFLYRLAGRPDVELPAESPFSDLEAGDGGYRAMMFMVTDGIASGYSDGTFRPNEDTIRRQIATFLYRFDQR